MVSDGGRIALALAKKGGWRDAARKQISRPNQKRAYILEQLRATSSISIKNGSPKRGDFARISAHREASAALPLLPAWRTASRICATRRDKRGRLSGMRAPQSLRPPGAPLPKRRPHVALTGAINAVGARGREAGRITQTCGASITYPPPPIRRPSGYSRRHAALPLYIAPIWRR